MIAMGAIVIILGFLLVLLVCYYLMETGHHSGLDYHTSVKLPQKAGKDQRQHPRTNVNWPVSMETSEGTIVAQVKSISLGGAFICCKNPLPIGEVVRMTITGPDKEPVTSTAKVVWSNANLPDEKVINRGMGVRFIKMSDQHLQLVRQLFRESDELKT
jgi:uncharacterized protein (TIGR02266 family)